MTKEWLDPIDGKCTMNADKIQPIIEKLTIDELIIMLFSMGEYSAYAIKRYQINGDLHQTTVGDFLSFCGVDKSVVKE